RLHLGAAAPHVRRHPSPDLGHDARARAGRARDACLGLARRLGIAHGDRVDRRLDDAELTMRTPLNRVRGLGSAHGGTRDFWLQRLTSIAAVPLTIYFVFLLATLAGRSHASVTATLSE